MERREVIRYLAWLTAGVAASACTPLRIITRSFPEEFKHDPLLVNATLRAFVATVIPRIDQGSADPAQALLDRHYPFAPYAPFFASDLAERAQDRYGSAFDRLTVDQRTAVVGDGLAADATTRTLYRGAIYLTQISYYAGIYNDDTGCPLIDFAGRYRGGAVSYDNADSFLPAPLTASGNFE